MLKKLEYTMKMANKRIEEIEDMDDHIQANLLDLFRRHLQEITPQARTVENIAPVFANVNPHLPGAEASVAYTRANETSDRTQESPTIEKTCTNSTHQLQNQPRNIWRKHSMMSLMSQDYHP